MKSFAKFTIAIAIMLMWFTADLEAGNRFRRSRGGGFFSKKSSFSSKSRTSSRTFKSRTSSWFRTGSKSSSGNVHRDLSRKVAQKGKSYTSRTEALGAFRKSQEFKSLPTKFASKPAQRPEYIPSTLQRNNQKFTVVYHDSHYGYWNSGRFIPLSRNDYHVSDRMLYSNSYYYGYRRHSAGSGFFALLLFLAIVVFIIFVLVIIARATRAREQRRETDLYTPPPIDSKHPILQKIYNLQQETVVQLSDPMTISAFDKAVDFLVTGTVRYQHDDFQLFEAKLRYESGDEPTDLSLFVKEVGDNFALFLGMLDHEGRNSTLEGEGWYHLQAGEDKFNEGFCSIFEPQEDKDAVEIAFRQFDFGGFYDVKLDGRDYVAVCEYFPEETPADFPWQHAIVVWQGDWIQCYYCKEIHEGNLDIYG